MRNLNELLSDIEIALDRAESQNKAGISIKNEDITTILNGVHKLEQSVTDLSRRLAYAEKYAK